MSDLKIMSRAEIEYVERKVEEKRWRLGQATRSVIPQYWKAAWGTSHIDPTERLGWNSRAYKAETQRAVTPYRYTSHTVASTCRVTLGPGH
jgi:hypothetical protein